MKKISFLMLIALLGIAGMSTSLAAQESPESFLGGLFSVSADKQVRFSKGNLQCTINGTDTAWAFAAHQYDMLGTANVNGSALANTIDLFGWSGNTATAKWGISLSIDDNDYSGDFADWGQNIGDGTTWRTLTNDEWTYLRSTRANASNLMGVARINLDETGTTYANGLILLPDTWTCPEGITFKSGFSSTNSEQTYADYQTFTLEQWAKLEAAGAVFLPVSGYRNGSRIYDVQNRGYYWSATPNKSIHASYLFFHSRGTERQVRNRCFGQAVRLVQDTYTVTVTCDAEQGSVSGAGTYPNGKELTLTATAAEGYYFLQWSDGTTSNPYTFTLTGDTALTAVFAANPVYNAVGGLFSVGEGKQVLFSAGNLQYTQSANVWAFAAHQYDMLGTANVNGSALANTIDLFGWSGSTATARWGISTSTDNNDYRGDFADWGQNIGDGKTWRTLTDDEWTYLRETRANAASLMGVARINLDAEGTTYANGLILLPDSWTCPEDVTFKSGFSSTNSEQAYAEYQTFTLEQWATLEASGAVFLPASGRRYGSSFEFVRNRGYFRSATPYGSPNLYARYLYFYSNTANWGGNDRYLGQAVRLVQDNYTVTATCDAEQGSVSGAGAYPNGKEVTLTATAAEHYHFVQWSNGETANPYTFTLAGDTTITAVFAIDQHIVTASGEHGTVAGGGKHNHGSDVTLTATADAHYHFVQWSNGETTNHYTFTLAGDTTINAVFAIDQHTVTAVGEHGTVTGAGTYEYGTEVTLEATADAHYHFVQWSNGETTNPYTFTLAGDTTINAVFAIDQHTVTAVGEHGTVTGAGTYEYGTEVTLEATADAHYHFVQWSNGETTNPYTFTLAGDTTINAVFAIDQHTVTASGENGTVTGAGTYAYGAEVTLTATANDHFHFVQWSDSSWANPYVFRLTQDIDLRAEFEAEPVYESMNGLFSVSADKHVVFSTGNLQYTHSTDVWSFASEQYKMIGAANIHDNNPSGKIDLFGWSGSTGVAEWGVSTSVSNIQYSGTFADWGEVIGDGNEWRTLTNEEWIYLHSGRAHASQLVGVASILLNDAGTEYVNGLVLLPDNWQCPDGVSFLSGFASENSADAYGDYQTFDLATWQVLEQSGAVFLPATGFRYGSIVGNAGIIGSYWSGSSYSTTGAYYIDIQSNSVDWYGRQRCYGHAVRLVQDYTGMLYNISATCDADKGRTIGSGMYAEGTVVTIQAIPAVGYIFVRWSDGNTENPRTFLATEEINLYAEIAEDKPTQLEPTSSETKARKIIHNGQIFIIRNQVIYDLTGRRIQ